MKARLSVVITCFVCAVACSSAGARQPNPDVKLRKWTKGIAVQSRHQEDMTMYLWFYEWHLFDAIRKARTKDGKPAFSSGGTTDNKIHVSDDQSEATIIHRDMVLRLKAGTNGADLSLTVTNNTDYQWPDIAAIVPCFNPGPPDGRQARYPEAKTNSQFTNRQTYCLGPEGLVHMDGRVCHYSRELRHSINERSVDGKGTFPFSRKWKPKEPDVVAGIMIRQSTDGRWVTGIAWERFVAVQAHNPWECMHLWIQVGPLKPKQSRTIRGKIYLLEGTEQDCLKSFLQDFPAAEARRRRASGPELPGRSSPRPVGRNPAAVEDQNWPRIREGHYVKWIDRIWNTRKPDRVWETGGVGTLGQRNGTGTYLGEEKVDAGSLEFDVKFDAGYLAPKGGGKHFLEIMSWMGDRSDREAIRARPSSRIELANLGDRPRCLVWNYGPHFRGRATKIFSVGPAFRPDRWYHIRFDWSYRQPAGRVTLHVDDRSYKAAFEFVPETVGPGRFFLFGHVETTQPEGRLHFREFRVTGAKREGGREE